MKINYILMMLWSETVKIVQKHVMQMITSMCVKFKWSDGAPWRYGGRRGVAEKQQTQKANSTADYSTLLEVVYHTRVYEYMAYICCSIYEQALYG